MGKTRVKTTVRSKGLFPFKVRRGSSTVPSQYCCVLAHRVIWRMFIWIFGPIVPVLRPLTNNDITNFKKVINLILFCGEALIVPGVVLGIQFSNAA